MGLLDDAIREHLELKRLRGADPSEVARLEREALGPVRRGAAGAGELTDEDELAPPAEPFDAERAADHPLVDDSDTLIPGGESSTVGQDTAEIDMETVIHADPHEDEDSFDAPFDAAENDERQAPHAAEPAPAEHHAHEPEAPEGEDVDDVLEETPSFLQQTPEHDRLWFEQQPPRDFDFDK
jgi:hypothetical protein